MTRFGFIFCIIITILNKINKRLRKISRPDCVASYNTRPRNQVGLY